MLTILYACLVAVFLGLTWKSAELYRQRTISYTLLLLIVLAGLVYDVLVIFLGRFIGTGDLLKTLNAGRFLVHGIVTPSMMIFGFGILRHAGVGWAQSRGAHIGLCLFTTAMIALGIYEDGLALNLQAKTALDTLRYVNEGGLKGPPIPSMLTIIFLIMAGVVLWRQTGCWWLAGGAMAMFIAAAIAMGDRFYFGNLGETLLGLANLLTAKRFLS